MDTTEIEAICDVFAAQYPALADPDGALDADCLYISQRLVEAFPPGRARVLHLAGHRHVLPNRHPYWHEHSNPDHGFYHVVCCVDDRYAIDMTYRQLDSRASRVYQLQSKAALMTMWIFASYDLDEVDRYMYSPKRPETK